ncbi:MAG: hypothetical protein QM526_02375 [Alphaproteobacteria bacterium]|nr:hypothetical protein [Alphaproteobacteria bacterium]
MNIFQTVLFVVVLIFILSYVHVLDPGIWRSILRFIGNTADATATTTSSVTKGFFSIPAITIPRAVIAGNESYYAGDKTYQISYTSQSILSTYDNSTVNQIVLTPNYVYPNTSQRRILTAPQI